jgi:hypothetical protein
MTKKLKKEIAWFSKRYIKLESKKGDIQLEEEHLGAQEL